MFDLDRLGPEQIRVFDAHLRALHDYQPVAAVPVPVTLFRASFPMLSHLPLDQTLGWSGLAKGVVPVHVIPGNHLSMTTEPLVRQLAKALSGALDAAQGAPG
jgi:thioesterase domain-containing protein